MEIGADCRGKLVVGCSIAGGHKTVFDEQADIERKKGFRGPFTRYFARLPDYESAEQARRDAGLGLIGIGAACCIPGLFSYFYLWLALLSAATGGLLFYFRSIVLAALAVLVSGIFMAVMVPLLAVAIAFRVLPNLMPVVIITGAFVCCVRAFHAIRASRRMERRMVDPSAMAKAELPTTNH
jgi:hypothetical protein